MQRRPSIERTATPDTNPNDATRISLACRAVRRPLRAVRLWRHAPWCALRCGASRCLRRSPGNCIFWRRRVAVSRCCSGRLSRRWLSSAAQGAAPCARTIIVEARIDTAAAARLRLSDLRLGRLRARGPRLRRLHPDQRCRGRQDLLLPAADAREMAAGRQGLLANNIVHLRHRRDPGAGLGPGRRHRAPDAGTGGPADPDAGHHLLRCVPRPSRHRDALSRRLRHADLGPARPHRPADRRAVRRSLGDDRRWRSRPQPASR